MNFDVCDVARFICLHRGESRAWVSCDDYPKVELYGFSSLRGFVRIYKDMLKGDDDFALALLTKEGRLKIANEASGGNPRLAMEHVENCPVCLCQGIMNI